MRGFRDLGGKALARNRTFQYQPARNSVKVLSETTLVRNASETKWTDEMPGQDIINLQQQLPDS